MPDMSARDFCRVFRHGTGKVTEQLRRLVFAPVDFLVATGICVAEVGRAIDNMHVQVTPRSGLQRLGNDSRGGAVRSCGEERKLRPALQAIHPVSGFRERDSVEGAGEVGKHLRDAIAAAALGDGRGEGEMRMRRDQAQHFSANVAGSSDNDCTDAFPSSARTGAHEGAPGLPVRRPPATRSPSAALLVSALIAGTDMRVEIWSTPTALSVAGPVTTAGSMPYCSRRILQPPQAATGSFAQRTTVVNALRMASSVNMASTPYAPSSPSP